MATLAVLLVGAGGEARGQLVILDDLLALTQASQSGGAGDGLRGGDSQLRAPPRIGLGTAPGASPRACRDPRPGHEGRLDPDRFAPRGPERLRVGDEEVLNIHPSKADSLPVRGAIRVPSPSPPPLPSLIEAAMEHRPDLRAYRLGIGHAEANVALNRSHGFKELLVFFTPITYEDRSRANELSTQGWGAGVMFEVPFFDFNRGQIRHAESNVIRTHREVDLLSRRIITEVQDAHQDFVETFKDLLLMEPTILPRAIRNRDAALGRHLGGEMNLDDMERDLSSYEELIRIYKDAIVRHRRSMLHLNAVVGCRILPRGCDAGAPGPRRAGARGGSARIAAPPRARLRSGARRRAHGRDDFRGDEAGPRQDKRGSP